jgi:hypothetical protein
MGGLSQPQLGQLHLFSASFVSHEDIRVPIVQLLKSIANENKIPVLNFRIILKTPELKL